MIPDGPDAFVKDERGAVVLSKLEPATLRDLADLTGGVYRDASAWDDLASHIQSTVEAGQKGKFMEKNSVRLVERYQWPLAAAFLCLVASFWREFPVRPKPRVLGSPLAPMPPPLAPAATTTAAALLCLVLLSAFASPLSAQLTRTDPAAKTPKLETPKTETPPPDPSAALTSIVTRLAAAPERSGRDWAELARETVTWGQRLQSGQQPVAPGPVNDALAAVTAGSALDPNTADWSKLREELNALLKKPDEKNQDDQKQDQDNKDQKDQNQPQDKNQQQQDKNKSKGDKSDQSQDQKGDPSQNSDDKNESKDSPENPDSKPPEGKDGQQAFGDMKDKESSPPPPPPEGDTQQVGGQPDQKPAEANADPALAMPLQKLEQLRNQDSPAKLFRLMQGDPGRTPDKKGKNW
jgi:Ca-activated chloride channel family protein